MKTLEPGDAIRLNDQPAEVIKTYAVGDLEDLEAYATSERERIETFMTEYERKAEAGTDMDIAIRGQRERLSKLEDRIEQRREELQRKAQGISLAPEVENLCLSLSI
jgi:hypothetical protein